MSKMPNIVYFGIDTLRRDRMSLYGYKRLTTPHMDKFLSDGVVFENMFSPSIPTPPGYASMLTGFDCFGTDVVALRHKGPMVDTVRTLPEILRDHGYTSTSIGLGEPIGRGFDRYLHFEGWGSYATGRSPKAENLNKVALPELDRLAKQEKPFLLFLRHMDPHAPYLAPAPFMDMFYTGDAFDISNKSLKSVYEFKPFRDFFLTWFPPGCTDAEYMNAQYDAEIAYMDACIQVLLDKLETLKIMEDTLVVFTSDHGESLNEHDCCYDHHSMYEPTLSVPFALKYSKIEGRLRLKDYVYAKDITPTILGILGIDTGIDFDGRNMLPAINGEFVRQEPECYITEATWMRKHGWRTPEWKLIVALEPDFHGKPPVELYNLFEDPKELHNVADQYPAVVKLLSDKMYAHIAKREQEVGRTNPMYTNLDWNGFGRPFASTEEAYNTLYIGDPETAKRLQAELAKMGVEVK